MQRACRPPGITILFNSPVDTSIFRALSFTPAAGGILVSVIRPHERLLSPPVTASGRHRIPDRGFGKCRGHPWTSAGRPFFFFVCDERLRCRIVKSVPRLLCKPECEHHVSFSAPADIGTIRRQFLHSAGGPVHSGSFLTGHSVSIRQTAFRGGRYYTVTLGTGIRSLAGDPSRNRMSFRSTSTGSGVEAPHHTPTRPMSAGSAPLCRSFQRRTRYHVHCRHGVSRFPPVQGTLTSWWGHALRFTPADSLLADQGYLVTVSPRIGRPQVTTLVGVYTFCSRPDSTDPTPVPPPAPAWTIPGVMHEY